VCGDGILDTSEGCDDHNNDPGDGCDADCATEDGYSCVGSPSVCTTTCGDGIKAGAEECDDHNLIGLDGCSATCRVDEFTETEPNNEPAQANGPYDESVLIHGAITPSADRDLFAIHLPSTADLGIETFDSSGPGHCANIDTVVSLLAADGTTVIATDDDRGIDACSRLDSSSDAALRRLPAGTYFVSVETYDHYMPIPGYDLVVRFNALCGDGSKQGFEECDGGSGCTTTCERVPNCGDGLIDAPEQCDDGNADSGDGCSAVCQYEVIAETEPNGTAAQASGPRAPDVLFGGAITPANEVDIYAIQLPTTSDLRLETFDATGPSSCEGIDTILTLYDTDGTTQLLRRDQGGVDNCSRIDPELVADRKASHLPAGTYYVAVESYLGQSVIPGYTLLATRTAVCGNGVVEGAEACDSGAGCTATCDRVPVCGDGFVDAPEQCDDGGVVEGDGCSATCQLELISEVESNDTAATANGPVTPTALIAASIHPGSDVDYFAVIVASVSDVKVETFDGNGPGSCVDVDTVATLLDVDGSTVLATADDGDLGTCADIEPNVHAGARQLQPGTYFLRIGPQLAGTVTPAYRVRLTLTAVCGNGVVEGWEECDGSASCDADCSRVPACSDGFVDSPETCDDGNLLAGDGCGATCQVETFSEAEPNDTTAEADASLVQLSGTATLSGAIGVVGDKDLVRMTLAQPGVARFEMFDATASGCSIATTLRLLDAGGVQLASDDNSGIASCSALVLPLAAGTYHVEVSQRGDAATIPAYLLEVRVAADAGTEVEPNETRFESTAVSGLDFSVRGGHQVGLDTDFFAVTVPPGKSIRAEIVEGSGAKTCESLDMDSYLTLYDAVGLALASDEDSGRGFCSRIDGTGKSPVDVGASHLPGGTYYLAVEASPFAQGDASGQFDYELAVTIR